jgi:hypothetical protein
MIQKQTGTHVPINDIMWDGNVLNVNTTYEKKEDDTLYPIVLRVWNLVNSMHTSTTNKPKVTMLYLDETEQDYTIEDIITKK